jgi:hypothetical protein
MIKSKHGDSTEDVDKQVGDGGANVYACRCTIAPCYYILSLTLHESRVPLFRSLNSLKHYCKRRSAARHFTYLHIRLFRVGLWVS